MLGVVVGSEDEKNVMNTRDFGLLAPGDFDPKLVDPPARALVAAFQTWIGVADGQILVTLRPGRIRSMDYGACFMGAEHLTVPCLKIDSICGRTSSFAKH